jgi:sugar phosphate isomerase/epimerase
VSRKLTTATLAEIERAGIGGVELFCSRLHFDYYSPQLMRELGDWFAGHRLRAHSLHAPTERDTGPSRESGVPISISDLERLRRLDAVDEIKRVLDLAEYFPFRYLIQHVCSSREPFDPRKWDAAFSSLEHLAVFAKQRGVTIALENTPGEMATPANLRHFVAETRLAELRFCFDCGHAHMEEGVESSFETMRELVATTHVHDNHGEKDEHLMPFEGTIDWNAALKLLSGDGPQPLDLPVVFELKEQAVPERAIERAVEAFDRLENARAARA